MSTLNAVESIFFAALEKQSPEERAAYLDEACRGDAQLRSCVQRLLDAHPKAERFLRPSATGPAAADPAPLEERPGTLVGPYKLLQQLGEGGFGVVFLAEQQEPVRRKVALKVVKPGLDSHQVVARFEQERQALALMDHPNIAKVLDGGTTASGRPYFVMELVQGVPITEFCDKNRLTPRERLELFVPVCQAIQHAHQKGVIHRDIKPSNVLVATYDGVAVPKVIDFGVAKAVDQKLTEKTLFTNVGQVVGTLEYMSPEQASLSSIDVDTRSDVYALGVLLFELLTGTTPLDREKLRGVAFLEMLRLVRESEPPRPSARLSGLGGGLSLMAAYRRTDPARLSRLVAGELDWIALKALDKDRSRRYETASALAADVRRYLSEEPVEARPPGAWYRLGKLARRNRGAVTAAALVAASLVAGTAIACLFALDARRSALLAADNEERADRAAAEAREQAGAALAEKRNADRQRDRTEWLLYASYLGAAQKEWEARRPSRMRHYLGLCPPDKRGWEHDYLWTLSDPSRRAFSGHTETVNDLAFSPDGGRMATASRDRTARVWDVATGRCVLTYRGHAGGVTSVAFSPDGKRVASVDFATMREKPEPGKLVGKQQNRTVIKVWDAASGEEQLTIEGQLTRRVAFSPDGKHLAGGMRDGTVAVWDAASGQAVRSLKAARKQPGRGQAAGGLAYSPDGKRLVCVVGGSLIVWDVASGEERLAVTAGNVGLGRKPAYSPDGKRLAVGYDRRAVKVWDAGSGKEILDLEGDGVSLAYSPDGQRLACGPKLWDAVSGRELLTPRGSVESTGVGVLLRPDDTTFLAFSPDGKYLAGESSDHSVKLWPVASGKAMRTLEGHGHPVGGVAYSPDGKLLASADGRAPRKGEAEAQRAVVKLWDLERDKLMRTLEVEAAGVGGVAFSPDGKLLAAATLEPDDAVRVWDVATGKQVKHFRSKRADGRQLAFSPDGRLLADGGAGKVWDLDSGEELLGAGGEDGPKTAAVAFSPDGNWVSFGSDRHPAKRDGRPNRPLALRGQVGPLLCVAYSPDGKLLAGACADRTVKAWDASTGHQVLNLEGHAGPVASLAFSPDGTRLATAATRPAAAPKDKGGAWHDGVKLWDVASGQEVLTLRGHADGVSGVAFGPDGKALASASSDGTVRLWDVDDGREVSTLHGYSDGNGGVAVSPDGKWVARGLWDRTVRAWDLATGRQALAPRGQSGSSFGVDCVAFSPDGKLLASSSSLSLPKLGEGPGGVILRDAATGRPLRALRGKKMWIVTHLAFSPDSKFIAATLPALPTKGRDEQGRRGLDYELTLWDAGSGEEVRTLAVEGDYLGEVCFSPDGKRLAVTSSSEKAIKVCDAADGTVRLTLTGLSGRNSHLAYSADGKLLAAASGDTIRLWDAADGKELLVLKGHTGSIASVAFSPDGKRLATAAGDRTVKIWETAGGTELLTLETDGPVTNVVFTPDGKRLVVGSSPVKVLSATRSLAGAEQE